MKIVKINFEVPVGTTKNYWEPKTNLSQKNRVPKKHFCQKWKKKNCSKLPEMARKLVENEREKIGYLKQIVKNEKN